MPDLRHFPFPVRVYKRVSEVVDQVLDLYTRYFGYLVRRIIIRTRPKDIEASAMMLPGINCERMSILVGDQKK